VSTVTGAVPVVRVEDSRAATFARNVWLAFAALWVATGPVLYLVAPPDTPPLHKALGLLIAVVASAPTAAHVASGRGGLPVFPMIMLVYALGYGMPIFFTDPRFWVAGLSVFPMAPDAFKTEALVLSLVGILCLQAGFFLVAGRWRGEGRPLLRLELDPERAQLLVTALGVVGLFMAWVMVTGRFAATAQFGALVGVLRAQAYLAVAVLYSYYLQGKQPRWATVGLAVVLFGESLLGLAFGNLAMFLFPWMVAAAVYWRVRNRFPWQFVAGGFLVFVLLQPVKEQYRYWAWIQGYADASAIERLTLWGEITVEVWGDRLAGGGSGSVEHMTRTAMLRGDHLHMFAHVLTYTPGVVPHWGGSSYSYFLVALIPRVIWPEKPIAQSANDEFAITYQLLPLELIGLTVVGLPHLIEAFINFGLLGIILVMALIGVAYGIIDRILNHPRVGEGGAAIYAVLLISLLTVESTTVGTFGGLIQYGAVYYFILRIARA
jgi:hypothetical protein